MRTNLSLFEAVCRRNDAVDAWMRGSTGDWLANPTVSALATAVRTTSVELAYAVETLDLGMLAEARRYTRLCHELFGGGSPCGAEVTS